MQLPYSVWSFRDCLLPEQKAKFIRRVARWAYTTWWEASYKGKILGKQGRIDYFQGLLAPDDSIGNPEVVKILQIETKWLWWTRIVPIGYTAVYPELEWVGERHVGSGETPGDFNQYGLRAEHIHHDADEPVTHYYVQAILLQQNYRRGHVEHGHALALTKLAYEQLLTLGLQENPEAMVFAELFHERLGKILGRYGWNIGPYVSEGKKVIAWVKAKDLVRAGGWRINVSAPPMAGQETIGAPQ